MEIFKYVIAALVGYLLGSISFSIIMSSGLFGGDVRKKGSGNAGATNMARNYGMGAGVATYVLDMAKAFLSAYVGMRLLGEIGRVVAGFACLLGHCFPIYYGFKGGKGVSVGCALIYLVGREVFVLEMALFFTVAFVSKKVSLASICTAVGLVVFSPFFGVSTPKYILALLGSALIIFQHRENIKRLIAGTEPDFKAAKSKK